MLRSSITGSAEHYDSESRSKMLGVEDMERVFAM